MRYGKLFALSLVLCVVFGCKKPSDQAWSAHVEEVDALNGLGVTFEAEGKSFAGMREGSKLAPGTRIVTPSGVVAVLALPNGSKLRVDGATSVRLDGYNARTAIVERGRVHLVSGRSDAGLTIGSHHMTVDSGTTLVAQVGPSLGSAAILKGKASVGDVSAQGGQVLELGGKPELEPIADLVDRLAWLQPSIDVTTGTGFGRVVGVGRQLDVSIDEHVVDIELTGGFAKTTITESFRNVGRAAGEGKYVFAVPDGAILTRVSVWDGKGWQDSKVMEEVEAEREYREATLAGKAVAMATEANNTQVTLGLGSIGQAQIRRVRVSLVQAMQSHKRGQRYVYRMPRDADGSLRAASFVLNVQAPQSQPNDLNIFGYDVSPTSVDQVTKATFAKQDFAPVGDLVIEQTKNDNTSTALRAKSADGQDYVALTLRPTFDTKPSQKPRANLLVVDTSSSRNGLSDQDTAFVELLLNSLGATDTLMVLACADACVAVGPPQFQAPQDWTPKVIGPAISQRKGNTNVEEVARNIRAVFDHLPHEGQRPSVFYLTDGTASAGAIRPQTLRTTLKELFAPDAPSMTVLTYNGDQEGLNAIANAGGGTVVRIDPDKLEQSAIRAISASEASVISGVAIDIPKGMTQVYPAQFPSLTPGQALTVLARMKDVPDTMTFSGFVGDKPISQTLPIEVVDDVSNLAAKAWAAAKIRELEPMSDKTSKEQVIALSKEHQILSKHTRLLSVGDKPQKPAHEPSPRTFAKGPGNLGSSEPSAEFLDVLTPTNRDTVSKQKKTRKKPKKKRGLGLADIGIAGRGGGGRGGSGYPSQTSAKPIIVPGKLAVQGSLDKEIIRRVVRQHRRELKLCYKQEFQKDPSLEGLVRIRFTIGPSGQVVSAVVKESTLKSRTVGKCLTKKIRRWVFPEPKGGGVVLVNYPFRFGTVSQEYAPQSASPISLSMDDEPIEDNWPEWRLLDGTSTKTETSMSVNDTFILEPGLRVMSDADKAAFSAYVHRSTNDEQAFDRALATGVSSNRVDGRTEGLVLMAMSRWKSAVIGLTDAAEFEPTRVKTQTLLANFLARSNPARSCAHRRAAADLQGKPLPSCGTTSELPWLQRQPSEEATALTDPVLTVRSIAPVRGDGVALRMIRYKHDGSRDWAFEPSDALPCRVIRYKEADTDIAEEICEWQTLEPGVYRFQPVMNADAVKPGTMRVLPTMHFSFQGETLETNKDVILVYGEHQIAPPEVVMPPLTRFGRTDIQEWLSHLDPIYAFCSLRSGVPVAGFSLWVEPDGRVTNIQLKTGDESAKECVSAYLKQLQFPAHPTERVQLVH